MVIKIRNPKAEIRDEFLYGLNLTQARCFGFRLPLAALARRRSGSDFGIRSSDFYCGI